MPAGRPPLAKRLKYYSIMIVLLLVVFELIARAYYYHFYSRHPVAFVQLMKDVRHKIQDLTASDTARKRVEKAQALLRPGSPRSVGIDISEETGDADIAVYKPWVEFAFRDFKGKYLNVSGQVRKSLPDQSDPIAKDPLKIYFLGGSTTYGFDVADAETIPSCFVRAYRQTHPNGRPIQVINTGMPFYYSYQELILLSDLLFRNEKPDMVIMLDGLNDCLGASNASIRAPAFSIGRNESFTPGSPGDKTNQLEDFFNLPPGMSVDSASKMISRQYIENIRHAHDLAGLYNIPVYCFWQPVPYYNYPNRFNDPICTHASSERFEHIYPLVRDSGAALPYFFFLGDMLQEEKGLPFVDQFHYSPRFSKAIAEKMLSLVKL